MKIYQGFVFPMLNQIDPELVHEGIVANLERIERLPFANRILRLVAGRFPQKPINLFGLNFPNVLGVAAGMDKNARIPDSWAQLGFGHVEVGTITPRFQSGNKRPRIFRLEEDWALINRMGFPNEGAKRVVPRLKELNQFKRNYVLGVSIGKQKDTPLLEAAEDYIYLMQQVYLYADYLAINISSPNTPELRELQGAKYLNQLLGELMAENKRLAYELNLAQRPLLVKVAPDLTYPELDQILTAIQDHQIDGIIATNTTISRDGTTSVNRDEQGGLSGLPLREQSTRVINYISKQTNGRLPIIGVGGVRTASDVLAKLDAGASLVQMYTGIIYEGPAVAGHILRQLEKFEKRGYLQNPNQQKKR